jgi:hypothetical protein
MKGFPGTPLRSTEEEPEVNISLIQHRNFSGKPLALIT